MLQQKEEEEEDYKEQVSWVGGGAPGKMTLHDAQPTENLFFGR
jgi:hypothetical protein